MPDIVLNILHLLFILLQPPWNIWLECILLQMRKSSYKKWWAFPWSDSGAYEAAVGSCWCRVEAVGPGVEWRNMPPRLWGEGIIDHEITGKHSFIRINSRWFKEKRLKLQRLWRGEKKQNKMSVRGNALKLSHYILLDMCLWRNGNVLHKSWTQRRRFIDPKRT